MPRPDKVRILDFDSECRPLAYLGGDFTTGELTAIAWAWVGDKKAPTVVLLGRETIPEMLAAFLAAWDQADLATGHYTRAHDLPLLNGAMMEAGLGPMPEKLVSDTKLDLVSKKHLSGSQENLAAMLGVKSPKVWLSNHEWRLANRLSPEGLKHTEARCRADVIQHMEMREKLIERGLLGPPKVWRP